MYILEQEEYYMIFQLSMINILKDQQKKFIFILRLKIIQYYIKIKNVLMGKKI